MKYSFFFFCFLLCACTQNSQPILSISNNSESTSIASAASNVIPVIQQMQSPIIDGNDTSLIPSDWTYRKIPNTPFEIPLVRTAVFDKNEIDSIDLKYFNQLNDTEYRQLFLIGLHEIHPLKESIADYLESIRDCPLLLKRNGELDLYIRNPICAAECEKYIAVYQNTAYFFKDGCDLRKPGKDLFLKSFLNTRVIDTNK